MKTIHVTKKNVQSVNTRNRVVWLALLTGLLLCLVFIPNSLLYSGHAGVDLLLVGFIVILTPYIVFNIIKSFESETASSRYIESGSHFLKYVIALISPMLLGLGLGIYYEHREKQELEKVGLWTTGIVMHVKPAKVRNNIKCRYTVQGQLIETAYHYDMRGKYKAGDVIRIIYNPSYPRMYEIEGNWDYE